MKKKGFMNDFLMYALMLFLMSIVLIALYMAFSKVNDAWQGTNFDANSKGIVSDFSSRFADIWDNVFIFWVIGLAIILIIIGVLLNLHPALIGIAYIFLIAVGIVGVHLANSFFNFSSSDGITAYAADFPKTSFIMEKFPHLILLFGIIFLVVMFAKSRETNFQL